MRNGRLPRWALNITLAVFVLLCSLVAAGGVVFATAAPSGDQAPTCTR
ncbi:MAG TPA: hypothetical protein VIR33_13935 [Thermopolyspora sp.]